MENINVNKFFNKQQCSKSKRFYPSFKKMIETGDETDYYNYLLWRKFKNPDAIIESKRKLIERMKQNLSIDPITIDGDIIVDGNHRLIIAKVLGWGDIIAQPGKLKENKAQTITENEIRGHAYQHIHRQKNYPKWRGVDMLKMPSDLSLYSEVIYETKPDIIIEIGTRFGGSAVFLQDHLDLFTENGYVVTVDIDPQVVKHDNRVTYLIGDSTSPKIEAEIIKLTKNKKVMFILDGDHSEATVTKELALYSNLVSPGCYLVLEDCFRKNGEAYYPIKSRNKFLENNDKFVQTNLDKRFTCGMNLGGWLRRK